MAASSVWKEKSSQNRAGPWQALTSLKDAGDMYVLSGRCKSCRTLQALRIRSRFPRTSKGTLSEQRHQLKHIAGRLQGALLGG